MNLNWIRDPQDPWEFAEDLRSFAEGGGSLPHPAEVQAPALSEPDAIIEAVETAERARDVIVLSPGLSEERPFLALVVVVASERDITALIGSPRMVFAGILILYPAKRHGANNKQLFTVVLDHCQRCTEHTRPLPAERTSEPRCPAILPCYMS